MYHLFKVQNAAFWLRGLAMYCVQFYQKKNHYFSLSINNIIDTRFIFFGLRTEFLYIFRLAVL